MAVYVDEMQVCFGGMTHREHFDICLSKRAQAVRAGAG